MTCWSIVGLVDMLGSARLGGLVRQVSARFTECHNQTMTDDDEKKVPLTHILDGINPSGEIQTRALGRLRVWALSIGQLQDLLEQYKVPTSPEFGRAAIAAAASQHESRSGPRLTLTQLAELEPAEQQELAKQVALANELNISGSDAVAAIGPAMDAHFRDITDTMRESIEKVTRDLAAPFAKLKEVLSAGSISSITQQIADSQRLSEALASPLWKSKLLEERLAESVKPKTVRVYTTDSLKPRNPPEPIVTPVPSASTTVFLPLGEESYPARSLRANESVTENLEVLVELNRQATEKLAAMSASMTTIAIANLDVQKSGKDSLDLAYKNIAIAKAGIVITAGLAALGCAIMICGLAQTWSYHQADTAQQDQIAKQMSARTEAIDNQARANAAEAEAFKAQAAATEHLVDAVAAHKRAPPRSRAK
jgi:hypothetical protein